MAHVCVGFIFISVLRSSRFSCSAKSSEFSLLNLTHFFSPTLVNTQSPPSKWVHISLNTPLQHTQVYKIISTYNPNNHLRISSHRLRESPVKMKFSQVRHVVKQTTTTTHKHRNHPHALKPHRRISLLTGTITKVPHKNRRKKSSPR